VAFYLILLIASCPRPMKFYSTRSCYFVDTTFNLEIEVFLTIFSFFPILSRHGLWTPNEAFFHQNSKLLELGRQFELINFGAFGVF
jgi:hypothetical protein